METAITHYQPRTLDELTTIAQTFAASGFFKDARDMAQAVVKMMAGAEMGFGPFASMQGVHIIQGKPVLSAGLITAAIENDPRYSFKVAHLEADGCRIVFYRNGGQVGEYAFMQADAQRAGLLGKSTWKQWPKDMYFSRAISGGARKFAAGIFGGAVYTPDEFDIETNEDGDIIELAPTTETKPDPFQTMIDPFHAMTSRSVAWPPDDIRTWVVERVKAYGNPDLPASDDQKVSLVKVLWPCASGDDDIRKHEVVSVTEYLIGRKLNGDGLTLAEHQSILAWAMNGDGLHNKCTKAEFNAIMDVCNAGRAPEAHDDPPNDEETESDAAQPALLDVPEPDTTYQE